MKKIVWIFICLVLVIIAAGATGCDSVLSPPSQPASSGGLGGGSQQTTGIWVTGTGEVTVTPDIAILQVGVESQESTVAEAQDKASVAMDAIIRTLNDSGVDNDDIQTQYFRIRERTRWDEIAQRDVITGYRVTNTVTAKIRDIEKTGGIIDSVVKAGGNLIRIDDLSFSVDDPTQYYDEAREKATADARDKAEKLARQANVRLGAPTYIAESVGASPFNEKVMFSGAAPVPAPAPVIVPSISPGELKVSLSVQIAYSIS
jgi:uncharacterized protein YggE